MKYLFVDNFRGFQETLLPIKDVNFFVGENSTGKTSLLALLKLLSSMSFWMLGRFSSEEMDFGNYEDIVSMHAEDKKYFHIGVLTGSEKDKKERYKAFLMTFSESDGMPRVERYTYIEDNQKAEVKFKGQRTLYKIGREEGMNEDYDRVRELFTKWLECHKKETRGFKELRESKRLGRNMAAVNALIQAIMKGKSDYDREAGVSFTWPDVYRMLIWLAPIRTQPQPIYGKFDIPFSPEGHHTPYSIKRLMESKGKAEEFKGFVKKFGRESGLFDSVDIKKYGKRKAAPFELDIILSGEATKITNVGYGISQGLPIIVELFERPKGCAYAIQQPEIHLHPKAQAALGGLFFDCAIRENKQFVVETHSDFIIDRFRMSFRSKKGKEKPKSQVVYFEKSSKGNILNVLDIDEKGNLPKEQPKGYREFFLKEDLRVVGY